MLQSWDMGQILSLPLRRKACGGFFRCPKNPTTSAGFEPANCVEVFLIHLSLKVLLSLLLILTPRFSSQWLAQLCELYSSDSSGTSALASDTHRCGGTIWLPFPTPSHTEPFHPEISSECFCVFCGLADDQDCCIAQWIYVGKWLSVREFIRMNYVEIRATGQGDMVMWL